MTLKVVKSETRRHQVSALGTSLRSAQALTSAILGMAMILSTASAVPLVSFSEAKRQVKASLTPGLIENGMVNNIGTLDRETNA